jgi:hemoglobin
MCCDTKHFRHSRILIPTLLAALVLAMLAGCQSMPSSKSDDSLYRALGARAGISRIDTRLILNIAADRRVSGYFRDTDIDRFHRMFTDYICALTGGPCNYSGDNMVDAHRGLGIDSAAFNAIVEDYIKAMNQEGVPTVTQNRLLARLAPLHSQIVGKHPEPSPEIMQLILGHDPMYRYIDPKL